MTRAIMVAFHKYQPYGDQYYKPILDHFIEQMTRYQDKYDKLYIIDSNWKVIDSGFDPSIFPSMSEKIQIIYTDPNKRYYDAYKEALPQVKEDLVLLMDNDFIVYKNGIIRKAFDRVTPMKHCVLVSIMDTIGTWKSEELNLGNKFCPYFFITHKNLLMKYTNIEWGPEMPDFETLGRLTKEIVDNQSNQGIYEMEDDKSNISFYGQQDGENSKDLGYYHVRAGSTPAVLLAWRDNAPDTYREYLHNQPQAEYLRQCTWYQYMGGNPKEIYNDCGITEEKWNEYYAKFVVDHGLV